MSFSPGQLLEPVKKHPVLIIGAVLGGAVILYLIYRSQASGGGAAVSSSAAAGPDPNAALAASTNLSLANLQLAGQTQQFQGQLALQQEGDQTDLAKTGIEAQIAALNINSQTDLAKYQTDASVNMNSQSLQTQIGLATLQTGLQEHIADVNAATSMASITSNADITKTLASLNADTTQNVAAINAAVNMKQIQSNVDISSINSQTQIAQANAAASTAKKQSKNSLIGSIAGGILGLFSDQRLKTNITLLYRRTDGVGVWSYSYKSDPAGLTYQGLIAQDVAKVYPQFVYQDGDYLKVDYAALGETEILLLKRAA